MVQPRIDLRWYFEVARRYWWLMLLTAALAAGLAWALTAARPSLYRATARVMIVEPTYLINLTTDRLIVADRLTTGRSGEFDSKTLARIARGALSEDVLLRLAESEAGQALPPAERAPEALKGKLSAEVSGDSRVVSLMVTDPDPERAASLANTWADSYAADQATMATSSADVLSDLEQPAAQARIELQTAEDAVRDFRSFSPIPALTEELSATLKARSAYLEAAHLLTLLQDQKADLAAGQATGGLTDYQLRVELAAAQLELGLSPDFDAGSGRVAQSERLASWEARFSKEAQDLEPRLMELQGKLAAARLEESRLLRERDTALQYSLLLDSKLQEARLAAALGATDFIRIRRRASVPQVPLPNNALLNAQLAGLVGLSLGALLAFGLELLRPRGRPALKGEGQAK